MTVTTSAERPTVAVLRRVLDASDTPALLVSEAREIVAANPAVATLVGTAAPTDLLGSSLDLFAVNDEVTGHNDFLLRQVTSGLVLTLTATTTFRRLDGSIASAAISQTRVSLAEGEFVMLAVVEPALDGTSSGMPQSGAPLAALVTDHDWRITHATPSARELLDAEDVTGMGVFGLVHPLDIANLAGALTMLARSGASISVPLKIRSGDHWRTVVFHAGAVCPHTPPRLVCLLADRPAATSSEPAWGADRVEAAVLGLAARRSKSEVEFTGRELEIIARSLRGERPAEIADGMFLDRGTVRNALTRIYRRLGVHSQTALIAVILTGAEGG